MIREGSIHNPLQQDHRGDDPPRPAIAQTAFSRAGQAGQPPLALVHLPAQAAAPATKASAHIAAAPVTTQPAPTTAAAAAVVVGGCLPGGRTLQLPVLSSKVWQRGGSSGIARLGNHLNTQQQQHQQQQRRMPQYSSIATADTLAVLAAASSAVPPPVVAGLVPLVSSSNVCQPLPLALLQQQQQQLQGTLGHLLAAAQPSSQVSDDDGVILSKHWAGLRKLAHLWHHGG